jgi:hypothetical protein
VGPRAGLVIALVNNLDSTENDVMNFKATVTSLKRSRHKKEHKIFRRKKLIASLLASVSWVQIQVTVQLFYVLVQFHA